MALYQPVEPYTLGFNYSNGLKILTTKKRHSQNRVLQGFMSRIDAKTLFRVLVTLLQQNGSEIEDKLVSFLGSAFFFLSHAFFVRNRKLIFEERKKKTDKSTLCKRFFIIRGIKEKGQN